MGVRVRGKPLGALVESQKRDLGLGPLPTEPGSTRLITRVRIHYRLTDPMVLFNLLLIKPWDFPGSEVGQRGGDCVDSVTGPA